MSSSLDAQEFIAAYLAEADEYLTAANTRLTELDAAVKRREASPRAVRELFRALHTIKGLSAMVGVEPVVDIAHEMETYLRDADLSGGFASASAVDALSEGLRAIETRIRALAQRRPVEKAPPRLIDALIALRDPAGGRESSAAVADLSLPAELLARLTASEKEQLRLGVAKGRRAVRVHFSPSSARAEQGISITEVRKRVEEIAEIVKVAPLTAPVSASDPNGIRFVLFLLTTAPDARIAEAAHADASDVEVIAAPASVAAAAAALEPAAREELDREDGAEKGSYIRVEVARLDDALERLSSLVVTRYRLSRAAADLGRQGADVRELNAILADAGRELRDLRGSIMRSRMVSVAEMLERVPLLVRSLLRSVGKTARVEIHAGRAELDKAVADRIFPALIHLVRNAVDHALEKPPERRARGKSEEGLIQVTCVEHSDNQLEISISDDGRGIDAEKVADRAGAPVPRTMEGLLDLICRPGLSTMDQATQVSGRGMGMDIVRKIAVDQLGGDLNLRTTPGEGTTFTLRLPLSITIVDAFSFVCGGQKYVVPVSMVEEIVEVDRARLVPVPNAAHSQSAAQLFERRGEAVPLVALSKLLRHPTEGEAMKALVVRRRGGAFAFAVDRMLGQQEVVVRPLEDPLVRINGVSGATDLGDGRPTLVLDLVAFTTELARSGATA